jgi:hypothetical protein
MFILPEVGVQEWLVPPEYLADRHQGNYYAGLPPSLRPLSSPLAVGGILLQRHTHVYCNCNLGSIKKVAMTTFYHKHLRFTTFASGW